MSARRTWTVRLVLSALLAVEITALFAGNRQMLNLSALAALAVVAVAWSVPSKGEGR